MNDAAVAVYVKQGDEDTQDWIDFRFRCSDDAKEFVRLLVLGYNPFSGELTIKLAGP